MSARRSRLLILAAAISFAAAACTSSDGPGPSQPPGQSIVLPSPGAVNATETPLLPTDRFELPSFTPDSFQELLSQLKGTPVVVNFWASWCGPCRVEGPHLQEVSRQFGTRVQFLGVDIEDTRPEARVSIRDYGWSYPSVFDAGGDIKRSFGFLGQPVTMFLDRDGDRVQVENGGNLVPYFAGPIPLDTLESMVRRLTGP
ncbi:MAG TPA: TlpA disulfide reductase family protein [Actinomycetota bacterium]